MGIDKGMGVCYKIGVLTFRSQITFQERKEGPDRAFLSHEGGRKDSRNHGEEMPVRKESGADVKSQELEAHPLFFDNYLRCENNCGDRKAERI